MEGEKERGKNCTLKNTAVFWDRARYLVVCSNILVKTSEVIVGPLTSKYGGFVAANLLSNP